MHAKATHARALLTAVSQRLQGWKRSAEQLPVVSVWQRVCEFIATHVTGFNWLASAIGTPLDALHIEATELVALMRAVTWRLRKR